MKSRLWLVVSILAIASLVLAGCGAGAAPTPTTAPVAEPTEAVQPTEAPEPTEEPMAEPTATEEAMAEPTATEEEAAEEATATPEAEAEAEATATVAIVAPEGFVIWADITRAPILEPLAEQFTEEYGVPVTVQQVDFGQIRDRFKQAGPAGEGPDIIIGAHDWLGELVENGLVAEIDLGEKSDQFDETALQGFTYDGTLYGMPYASENLGFFRNTDLVPEAPATWEEVMQICGELTEAGSVELCFPLQQADPYHYYPVQTAFGGYVFGQNEEGTYDPEDVGIDSPGSIAAAEFLDQMVQQDYVRAEVTQDIAKEMFLNGQAAFYHTGPWNLQDIRDSGVPYAISDFPDATEEGRPFLGVQGFMISAFSEDPLLAQTFLTEFVATEETMLALFEAGQRPPAFIPAAEQIEDEDLSAFALAGENAQPLPAIPAMASVWSAWSDAITLILQQQEEPEAAFTNAAEQIRTLISQQ